VNLYEYILESLESGEGFSEVAPLTSGVTDDALNVLITNLRVLSQQKTRLELVVTDDNPLLVKTNLEIQAKLEDLRKTALNILETAKESQVDVNRQITQLNRDIQQLPETERTFVTMERRFKMANEIYTFLSQRRAEAAIAEASNVPDQSIIDEARVDAAVQVSPKTKMNYAIGGMLGLVFPLMILILLDFLNTRIREKEDITSRTDVPIMGTVGHNRHDEFLPVIMNPRSSIAESFRAIRTDLQFMLYKEDQKVIMITSTTAGEGKSFISMNLAAVYSVTNKKSVVVGLDLRRPVIQNYMNLDNKEGVSTHLIGNCKIEDIIFESGHPNLWYIPSGPVPPNPAELFNTEEFENFIAELKKRFDIILLDTPPVALVTDATLIAKHSDVNLFIVRQNITNKASVNFIDQFADKKHIKNLHIIINDVVVPRYYGYKYGYGYGYGYGKGYGSGYYVEEK